MNPEDDREGRRDGMLRAIGPYIGIGIELALYILLLLLAGRWLDSRWGTEPWLMIAGAALGFVLGFYSLFKTLSGLSGPRNKGSGG